MAINETNSFQGVNESLFTPGVQLKSDLKSCRLGDVFLISFVSTLMIGSDTEAQGKGLKTVLKWPASIAQVQFL